MISKIQYIQVIQGVFWVEIKPLDLRILCACPPDIVKHLMLRGLINEVEEDGITFETGPNAILLSDVMLQNGQFSNMAEFPVLQMLYKQGMIIPNHPGNSGYKPLLIGLKEQINAQMEYIYRGNYGLVSYEEIIEAGVEESLAKDLWRMKKKFAFGHIRQTEELLDSIVLESDPIKVHEELSIKRIDTNVFEFSYQDETLTIDINLSRKQNYIAPYPLGFHDIKREYFSVIHSGQGDGFDVNRPSMSSIITFQGKVYVIDAGPNISYSLTTLGFGINEIEGVFQTHAHDDHFAGITTLMRSDHRIKFYAAPIVRSSVFKKLAVLLGKKDNDFSDFFDVQDMRLNKWNDINGLEVRPIISPHPVETTIFLFKTYWGGEEHTYAHFADITSMNVLEEMVVDDEKLDGISQEMFERVKKDYLAPADLKKIDIGGGMIHGDAEDFAEDESKRIILAHTAHPLTSRQKEIGSSAPFGIIDLMVPEFTNYLHRNAAKYLENYFDKASSAQLEKILNNAAILYPPGSLILKKGDYSQNVFLVLTGYVEKISSSKHEYNLLSAGSFIGEYSGLRQIQSESTFRSVSYVQTLQIPTKSYQEFIKKCRLFTKIERLHENQDFLSDHWLFKESLSAAILNNISSQMELKHYYHEGDSLEIDPDLMYMIKSGQLEIIYKGESPKIIGPGEFLNFEKLIKEEHKINNIKVLEPSSVFELTHDSLKNVPIVLWKLVETFKKELLKIKS